MRAALLIAATLVAGGCARAEEPAPVQARAVWGPFAHAPLDTLVLTASFGEYRGGHLHAGLDLSTQQAVGRVVYAPVPGWVRRVRASGVGYGRGLYFQADDGRLFVFGHLDGLAEPMRSRVAALQDSTGEYEQDLTFLSGRIRFAAGDTLAWTGESGAGPPHLHMEIRRGDTAVHPLTAGLTIADTMPPRLVRLTLAPMDDTSFVASPAEGSVSLASAADTATIVARGRFRAVVEAFDPREDGAGRLAPYRTRVAEIRGGREAWFVESRYDSASWAGDMAQVDFVYDRGRATRSGRPAQVLWAPPGFRPVVFHTSAPIAQEAGAIEIGAGSPPRELALLAGDPAGNTTRRVVRLRAAEGPSPPPRAPDAGKPPAARPAAHGMTRAAATIAFDNGARFEFPESALFAPETLRAEVLPAPPAGPGWRALGGAVSVTPALAAMRTAARVRLPLPRGADASRVGIARYDEDGWSWLGAHVDTAARAAVITSRRLGTFALLRDVLPPRHGQFRVRSDAFPRVPYSRWAIELRAWDDESGVDSRASHLVVDGRRVPTEVDADAKTLRWRPVRKPKPGPLRVEAVIADAAGNRTRFAGSLVVR